MAVATSDASFDVSDVHSVFDACVLALENDSKGISGMAAAEAFEKLESIARHCRVTRMWQDADCISEVDTNDVRLVAADAHAAAAVERAESASAGGSPAEARARAVVRASAHLCEFIRTCAMLGIMQPPDIAKLCAAAEVAETAREEASLSTSAASLGSAGASASTSSTIMEGTDTRTGRATAAALDAAAAAAAECKPVAVAMLESAGEDVDAEVISEVQSMDRAARAEAVSALTRSPEARRAAAVARFKRQQALRKRLALLRALERRAIALDRLAEDGVGGRGSEAVAGASLVGDDARRERALIEVSLMLHQAVDDIVSMADEGKILGRLLTVPDDAAADARASAAPPHATGPGLVRNAVPCTSGAEWERAFRPLTGIFWCLL